MIDPRDRHFVSKLERCELEDKYLRLMDEMQCLKKLSNRQEDKIKRLATKFMRVSANPRACINVHDICSDKERISTLECENNKLKNKVNVLRNQLLSHVTQGRSPSRCRKLTGTPSGATTSRSDRIRPKTPSCHCLIQNGYDDSQVQKYQLKIQELEAHKMEMASRISELEVDLTRCMTGNHREKIAENVGHIRAWRQIKEYREKLEVIEKERDCLIEEVDHLKQILQEKTKNNKEIIASLMAEKKKMADMNEQMVKAKDSQLSLREKDEQIRDLMNEMKILQQHNSELIALSTKYSQVEVENQELKKKMSEQLCDHQILKTAFSNEQANVTALQSANSQLLEKLHELQSNIDILTIQLMAFQGKPEKETTPREFVTRDKNPRHVERRISTSSTSSRISENSCGDLNNTCKKLCEVVMQKPEINPGVSRESQTERSYLQESLRLPEKKEVLVPQKDSPKNEVPERKKSQDMNGNAKVIQNGSPLSRERMLKLLDQAQINTPFETQNARLKQIDPISESVQKQRLEKNKMNLVEDLRSPENRNQIICPNPLPINDPNKILSLFSEILREYNVLKTGKDNWNSFLKADRICRDLNNNATEEIKKRCFKFEDVNNNIFYNNNNERLDTSSSNSKKYVKEDCSCICDGRCPNYYKESNGRYVCCCTEKSFDGNKEIGSFKCKPCSKPTRPIENVVVDISASIKKTFDTMYLSRKRNSSESENDSSVKKKIHSERTCGNWCREPTFREVVKEYAKDHSDRSNFGKLLKEDSSFKEKPPKKRRKKEEKEECDEKCSCDCNSTSELENYPMLITKNQGLLEMHIVCFQLSRTAVRLLLQDCLVWNAYFFISWDIRGQKTAFTPALKYPELNFDSSSIFVVSELFDFLDYIFEEYITFDVHVHYPNDTTHIIAQTKLCVKEVLDYPHNTMQYIATVNSIIPCSLGTNFGQMSLWVRLSCDLDKIKDFKAQRGIVSEDINQEPITKRIKKGFKDESDNFYSAKSSIESFKRKKQKLKDKSSEDQERPTNVSEKIVFENKESYLKEKSSLLEVIKDFEIDAKQESEQQFTGESYLEFSMTNLKNITSKSTSEITENEASEDNDNLKVPVTKNLPKAMKEKITKESSYQIETEDIVEFNKMLSNGHIESRADSNSTLHDIHEVFTDENWDKYRKRSLESPNNTSEKPDEKELTEDDGSYSLAEVEKKLELIVIEVNSISLFQGSFKLLNPNIKQLYVEYSFLGYFGEDMESESVFLPTPPDSEIIYNFRKEFLIDEETHHQQRLLLQQMLNEVIDPHIKFFVVSEPLKDEKDKECEDVGFAQLNLKDYVSGSYPKKMSLSIFNPEKKRSLGLLRVTVDGIDTMKNCL